MAGNTTYDAVPEFITTIKSVQETLNQGLQLFDLLELIKKVDELGSASEVRLRISVLENLTNTIRSLLAKERTHSLLKKIQPLIQQIAESISKLNLDLLSAQSPLIGKAKTALSQQGDVRAYLSKIADVRSELDALQDVVKALTKLNKLL